LKLKRGLIPTLKEYPKDAVIRSHQLLIRAGYIRSVGSGIYSYLPLGFKSVQKVINVIREEMNNIDAQEIILPIMSPADIWKETGRWEAYGSEMFRLKDRKNHDMVLAPTHEELITDLARKEIRSYKELPQIWYHFQWKFRDEIRPKSGLLRTRLFIMKDSYSLDTTFENLHKSYQMHYKAYSRMFERLGLNFHIVSASSGLMGGSASQEFMVESEVGEDRIIVCDKCNYASNIEIATADTENISGEETELSIISTPVKGNVKSVAEFLHKDEMYFIKSLLYIVDSKPVFILLRGDDEIENEKLNGILGINHRPATDEEIEAITRSVSGYISPYGLKNIEIIADKALKDTKGLITGANIKDKHIIGVDIERDFKPNRYADFRRVKDGDKCPECGSPLRCINTIELGHIFELGTKYSKAMNATYLDKDGVEQPIVMGSYGIGVERLLQTCIEVFSDDDGIILPKIIAPFDTIIMPLNSNDENIMTVANNIYEEFKARGIDVLFDDRDIRAGSKFKDADLLGIPIQIRMGRKFKDGIIEIKIRKTGEILEISLENLIENIEKLLSREDI